MAVTQHHPYRDGYSVLPQLRRINEGDVFEFDAALHEDFLQRKQESLATQVCRVEQNCPKRLKDAAREWLLAHYPHPQNRALSLEQLTEHIGEDLVIHSLEGDRDWMAYGAVYFPSGWRPEYVVGKSFAEIHQVVPGMNVQGGRRVLQACVDQGPFERFVWSVVFAAEVNGHPDRPKTKFDPRRPQVWVKVERQVLVGLPEQSAFLFWLRQSLIPEPLIDRPALLEAVSAMTAEQRQYKGLTDCYEDLVRFLEAAR